VLIPERPAAIEDRAASGHWEGDLLSGSRNSYIATLIERHMRYVMLVKVADTLERSFPRASSRQRRELYKSLTGTGARSFIDDLRWQPISTSTFAIYKVRGSAAPMRTPNVCRDSSEGNLICACVASTDKLAVKAALRMPVGCVCYSRNRKRGPSGRPPMGRLGHCQRLVSHRAACLLSQRNAGWT
jgi:hypothetical protein